MTAMNTNGNDNNDCLMMDEQELTLSYDYTHSFLYDYTITFYSKETGESKTVRYNSGDPVTLPNMERSGYKLSYWCNPNGALMADSSGLTYNSGEPGKVIYPKGNATLYAVWEKKPLTSLLNTPLVAIVIGILIIAAIAIIVHKIIMRL